MVSQVRAIARSWRQILSMLGISEDEIDLSEEVLCEEEKCFMVLEKWLETSKVSLEMLKSLLTSLGFMVVTAGEH